MAVTNLKVLNPGDKPYLAARAIGDGAPASTDKIVTDLKTYPIGSSYFDKTNNKEYRRRAAAGVVADWVSGVALT